MFSIWPWRRSAGYGAYLLEQTLLLRRQRLFTGRSHAENAHKPLIRTDCYALQLHNAKILPGTCAILPPALEEHTELAHTRDPLRPLHIDLQLKLLREGAGM